LYAGMDDMSDDTHSEEEEDEEDDDEEMEKQESKPSARLSKPSSGQSNEEYASDGSEGGSEEEFDLDAEGDEPDDESTLIEEERLAALQGDTGGGEEVASDGGEGSGKDTVSAVSAVVSVSRKRQMDIEEDGNDASMDVDGAMRRLEAADQKARSVFVSTDCTLLNPLLCVAVTYHCSVYYEAPR
jgi:hypothetical protein